MRLILIKISQQIPTNVNLHLNKKALLIYIDADRIIEANKPTYTPFISPTSSHRSPFHDENNTNILCLFLPQLDVVIDILGRGILWSRAFHVSSIFHF